MVEYSFTGNQRIEFWHNSIIILPQATTTVTLPQTDSAVHLEFFRDPDASGDTTFDLPGQGVNLNSGSNANRVQPGRIVRAFTEGGSPTTWYTVRL